MKEKQLLKNKKIDYFNIIISLCIFILLQLIILPPIFRRVINFENKNNNNIKKNILICNGVDKYNKIKIHSSTLYLDNIPKRNIITYTKINDKDIDSFDNIITNNILVEIEFFKNINGVKIDNNNNQIIVNIYDYNIAKNDSNYIFTKYLDYINNQKQFYQNAGYKCIIKTK